MKSRTNISLQLPATTDPCRVQNLALNFLFSFLDFFRYSFFFNFFLFWSRILFLLLTDSSIFRSGLLASQPHCLLSLTEGEKVLLPKVVLSKCKIIIFVIFLLHVSTRTGFVCVPVYPCKELVVLEPCCEDPLLGPVFSYCGPLSWTLLGLQEDFYNPLFRDHLFRFAFCIIFCV